MRPLAYSFEEAVASLGRGGRSVVMSAGTIAIAFLTLGGFLLVSKNLESAVERWASAAEMSVYLRDDVDDAARDALISEMKAHPAVAAVEFIAKDQALERFKSDFPELGDVVGAESNPFPPSIEARLRTDSGSAGAADAMATALTERAAVADVRYDRQWLPRLTAMITTVRLVGIAVAAVLVLGAAFTVAAVVRLSLQAREAELDIMHLVGAPFAFVRGPSIAEGTLLGGIGALLSLIALWALFAAVRSQVNAAVSGLGHIGEVRFLGFGDGLLLILAGLIVGALAGLIASRVAR